MKQKTFQIILYIIFGFLFILGFVSLALFGFLQKEAQDNASQNSNVNSYSLLIWGTYDSNEIDRIIGTFVFNNQNYGSVEYIEKNPLTIESEYINSFASGTTPDLIFASHNLILDLENTLQTVKFTTFPFSQFENTFINASDIFLRSDGYIAIPFLADPFVLYQNESLVQQNEIKDLPRVWADFLDFKDVIERYKNSEKALIPLGAYQNYKNSSALFLSFLLQANANDTLDVESITGILNFYLSFSNPSSEVYSWNSSFLNAEELFVGDNLVYYPGYVSEYETLRRSNRNIVIKANTLPQLTSDGTRSSSIRLYGFAIPSNNRANLAGSTQFIFDMLGLFYNQDGGLNNIFSLPPAIKGFSPTTESSNTEIAFIDSLFFGDSIYLPVEANQVLLNVLRGVSIGSLEPEDGAEILFDIFNNI